MFSGGGGGFLLKLGVNNKLFIILQKNLEMERFLAKMEA